MRALRFYLKLVSIRGICVAIEVPTDAGEAVNDMIEESSLLRATQSNL